MLPLKCNALLRAKASRWRLAHPQRFQRSSLLDFQEEWQLQENLI
jgi:hypothetical protein